MLTKDQLIEPLIELRGEAVVVTTMGIVRLWGRHSRSPLDFASADSAMGHAADLALGIALARPNRKVICLNGDGSMVMTLGTLLTAVEARARNFVLYVLQNDRYEITGNQATPAAGQVDFVQLARGAGFKQAHLFDDPETYSLALPGLLSLEGPILVNVKIEEGNEPPLRRGSQEPYPYLQTSLAESAHSLRQALTGT